MLCFQFNAEKICCYIIKNIKHLNIFCLCLYLKPFVNCMEMN